MRLNDSDLGLVPGWEVHDFMKQTDRSPQLVARIFDTAPMGVYQGADRRHERDAGVGREPESLDLRSGATHEPRARAPVALLDHQQGQLRQAEDLDQGRHDRAAPGPLVEPRFSPLVVAAELRRNAAKQAAFRQPRAVLRQRLGGARSVRVHSRNAVACERGSDQGEGTCEGSADCCSSGILQRFDPDSRPVLAEGTVAIREGDRGSGQAERRGGGDLLVAEAVQPAPDGGEAASVEVVGEAVGDQLGRTLDVPAAMLCSIA